MKKITLTISDISRINSLQKQIQKNAQISLFDRDYLISFLSQIPASEVLLSENIPLNERFEIQAWNIDEIEVNLKNWLNLFNNIPGYDYVSCWFVQHGEQALLSKQVIITVCFAPSMSYNASHISGYYIWIKDDGTASFQLPTLQDAELYPELYNFKGSWKEAYYLLIKTLKKGWPMEEFPEELQKFLKKE